MGSNSGIERNWLVSVNGLNIYYSPESKTIKSMSNLSEELSSIKPSTMPDTYWITLQALLTRERAVVMC